MPIPREWLIVETTPADIEADLAEGGAPDLWLRAWRALRERMAPGDELWRYAAATRVPSVRPAELVPGFDQVLDREVLERILSSEPGGSYDIDARDDWDEWRSGYALVRDGEIVDWIEEP